MAALKRGVFATGVGLMVGGPALRTAPGKSTTRGGGTRLTLGGHACYCSGRIESVKLMGLRFYRRLPLLPGVRLNVSTRGASVSFGHRGAWYTMGANGRRTASLGWPGTGLRYTTTTTAGTRRPGAPKPASPPAPSAARGVLWLVLIVLFVRMAYVLLTRG